MSDALLLVTLALYLLATMTFVGHIVTADGAPPRDGLRRAAHVLLALAFGMHLAHLLLRSLLLGYEALATFQDELSFIACLMVGLYLITALRVNVTVVGALVTPLAFLFSLSAYAFNARASELSPRLQTIWLPAHVAPAFLGYAVFTVAFCLSLIYLLQEKQLKAKRKGDLFRRLPSLETLDNLNYRFVSWGFALFTIGLITGALLARQTWGQLWSWEPVEVLSLITWLLYAGLLHARTVGWRGRKAAALTILGFLVVVASFLGVNLLFPGKHGGTFG
jgi:cytochrome c-type biogenesis protein CcsB